MTWTIGVTLNDVNVLDDFADRLFDGTLSELDVEVSGTINPGEWIGDEHENARYQLRGALEAGRALIPYASGPGSTVHLSITGHVSADFAHGSAVTVTATCVRAGRDEQIATSPA